MRTNQELLAAYSVMSLRSFLPLEGMDRKEASERLHFLGLQAVEAAPLEEVALQVAVVLLGMEVLWAVEALLDWVDPSSEAGHILHAVWEYHSCYLKVPRLEGLFLMAVDSTLAIVVGHPHSPLLRKRDSPRLSDLDSLDYWRTEVGFRRVIVRMRTLMP